MSKIVAALHDDRVGAEHKRVISSVLRRLVDSNGLDKLTVWFLKVSDLLTHFFDVILIHFI